VATATAPQPSPVIDRRSLLSPWPRISVRGVLLVAALALLYIWGLAGTQVKAAELIQGIPQILDFIRRLMPPAWKTVETPLATPELTLPFGLRIPAVGPAGVTVAVPEVAFAIIETIQMALVGTSIAVVASLPFGLLAARNTSPHRVVYQATRLVLNMIRAIPEIVFALIFVAAVGLGPFSGVLALSVAPIGYMGKLYAEAIEAIDPQQVLAVSATGANRAQTFVYGVVPQALPLIASYSLLVFEANVRTATILGIVGAGGVGFVLNKYMALFQYQYLMGAIVFLILAVTCIDRISDSIRRRLT
jgi:phosphonate transport system permease protein